MSSLGLYLHIPFCAAICNYCNFNRFLLDADLKRRYVDALALEIERAGAQDRAIHGRPAAADTIYFGGGTPSLLDPAEVQRLVGACRGAFDLSADTEVTLEANPETVTTERLAGFHAAGVNRLSFGVQSFRDEELQRLGRLHSAERAADALGQARSAGFDNVSLDLMLWLPGQTPAQWLASVARLIALEPDHASLYMLEVYPNAPLREEMARRQWTQAPDEDVEAMYLGALAALDAAGYAQYEISNVARPGRRSRHNLKYWTDREWLGFGCGAHSTRDGVRWKQVASAGDYVGRVMAGADLVVERRVLTPVERVEEALFTGLRLTDGLDLSAIDARYGVDVWGRYGHDLSPHLDAGLLVREPGRLRLTRHGMLLAHEVMTVFV
ncbi:MAG: radical SAM family heme chaperone HemW [Acidobacteriota bacterium]|nr:radical SAM family heme chaperone HemW [Acidobacteriota bacterium]